MLERNSDWIAVIAVLGLSPIVVALADLLLAL
jgi:hypothetical protein